MRRYYTYILLMLGFVIAVGSACVVRSGPPRHHHHRHEVRDHRPHKHKHYKHKKHKKHRHGRHRH